MPMTNPKQKNIPKIFQSKVLIVIEIAIVLFLIVAVGQEVVRRKSVQEEVSRLELQIEQLESQNVHLAETLKEMTSENYIEKEARRKLDLQKKGETVILVPHEETDTVLVSKDSQDSSEAKPANPSQWWSYFFGTTI